MAALVTISTYIIQIPVPATNGYINIGDAMVFTCSLAFGPFIGSIAGGLGSSIADMLAGYWTFVPITFIVKGLEGFITGLISNGKSLRRDILAVLIGGTVMVCGYLISEAYMLGYGSAALVEVPGNLFQIAIGGFIGIPVSFTIKKYIRGLR
jgi:uncharacterized membrane protein